MRMMGFGRDDKKTEAAAPQTEKPDQPVRSLVRIRFDRFDRELTYFNDRFDLKEGDRVFVSGKLAGQIGVVISVTTKFRIKRSDYECVIAPAQTPIHGTYRPVADKMLSYDGNALSPEAFRMWVMPPEEPTEDPEDEVIIGDGYEIPLDDPRRAEGVDDAVFRRALDICRQGRVGYIAVRDGVGRAYVEGEHWYELEFCMRNHAIAEAYCGCPYPGLCKHLLAVAVTLSAMSKRGEPDLSRDFVLIDADRFFGMVRQNELPVTV